MLKRGQNSAVGNTGADVLTGGAGADVFKYTSISDSTTTQKDTIADFKTTDGDKIDLSAIDAKVTAADAVPATFVNDKFSDVILARGAAFTAAGQLRYNAVTKTLEGNTDANLATVEFSVVVTGVTTIAAADIIA